MIDTYIKEAESWIGTPFRLQARVKGKGVDCIMMIFEALSSIGIVYAQDRVIPYKVIEHKNSGPGMARIFEELAGDKFKLVLTHKVIRGDVVTFNIGRKLLHVSIATGPNSHIHVCCNRGVVSEAMEPAMKKRISYVYRYTGVTYE